MEYLASTEAANITSPGYPNNYSNNIDSCVTKVYTNESKLIRLEFEEFSIEYDSTCGYDYLEVFK